MKYETLIENKEMREIFKWLIANVRVWKEYPLANYAPRWKAAIENAASAAAKYKLAMAAGIMRVASEAFIKSLEADFCEVPRAEREILKTYLNKHLKSALG